MSDIVPQFSFPPLYASATSNEFALHESALEWSLADPIIIERAEDIKSRVNWQERLKPFRHQMQNLMTFCRRLPVTLLTDDVGLGKTISAGLILSELMIRNRVSRTLIICPSILGPQWVEELESKFGIRGKFAVGKQLDAEFSGDAEVVVTTYHTASGRLDKIEPGKFDMLILDEAHKLRNLHGTQKPPMLAQRIHKSLNARLFKYVLMLTATPIQNRLWDIYSLVDCLAVARGHINPLGTPDHFRFRFIADYPQARELNPHQAEDFRAILRQYLVRTRRQDANLKFPQRLVESRKVEASLVDLRMQTLVANCVEGLNGLQQSSIAVAMMSSPQALISQFRNMAKMEPTWNSIADEAERINRDGLLPSKLRYLLGIIQTLRRERPADWRLVVFTTRTATLEVICKNLESHGIAYGRIRGGEAVRNTVAVKAFTMDPPAINVIVSTDAGSEGVNLQAGNVLVNYDLPWNPMVVEQRIGRVQRLGSKHEYVVIYNLAVAGSPEERVVARLMEKLQTIVDTVGDIEAILEASLGDSDARENSFEKQIRELVLKSLKGQDVDIATQLKVQSIQEAKTLFEEQREFIDSTLGQLSELHQTGPMMPRLTSVSPSIPSDEFVRSAMRAEGFNLLTDHGESLRAEKRGQPSEFITFDELYWRQHSQSGVFQGKALRLYKPGKPAFERLVQRWLDRSAHFTKTFTNQTKRLAQKLAESWLTRIEGSAFSSIDILSSQENFQGRSRFRVTASNAVDSYEKLIDIETIPHGHERVFDRDLDGGTIVYEESDPKEVDPAIENSSREVCAADSDISAFCDFYLARLKEEQVKAGFDEAKLKKVKDDFGPAIHAQVAALTGVKYHDCQLRIRFTIDGHGGYSSEIDAIPLTGQIVGESQSWEPCQKSGRAVPSGCLGQCCISGQLVLRHYLKVSDESGRKALEEHVNICSITGRVAINDEFLCSDLSGRRAVASAFQSSEMSGRRGLVEECTNCDFTGSRVLLDELETSEISGMKYRSDQRTLSAVSNRAGHQSEFVTCDFSKSKALPAECGTSDLSGRLIRRDLMESSGRPPSRNGAPDELVTCPVTRNRLLIDETGVCVVTSQQVDDSLLAKSDESGLLALIALLKTCELSGRRLLPDETVCSVVSNRRISKLLAVSSSISGQSMLPEESFTCEITGAMLLPTEIKTSDVSGKRFRSDEQIKSHESGRIGHRSEGDICRWSGRQLLDDEVCRSMISGRTMQKSLAAQSPLSGRLAHPDEFQQCQFSNVLVFPDELVISDVSGKALRVDEMLVSTSGRSGHVSEHADCEFTGQKLLTDEVILSAVSGKRIAKSIAQPSAVSGCLAAPDELGVCEMTGIKALPSELSVSDVSGKRFRSDEQVQSDESGRVGHCSEETFCSWTRRRLLADESTHSDITGRILAKSDAKTSPVDGRRGHSTEFQRCQITGIDVLEDELLTSAATGRTFRCDEVFTSVTGRQGHISEQTVCEFSQQALLSDEVVTSAVSGKSIFRALAGSSEVSGELAAPQELVSCEITGVWVSPSELIQSDVSGKAFRCDEQTISHISQRVGHQSESTVCKHSGHTFLSDEMGTSDLSGKQIARAYLLDSPISGRKGTAREFGRCDVTGQNLLLDELGRSIVSGTKVDKSLLVASDRSGNLALADEMVRCQVSGAQLLPEETTTCAASGMIVDSRLVRESDFSRARALPNRMLRCSITGRMGMPKEFGKCQLTDELVALSMLQLCEVTKKMIRRDRLVQSSLSGRWMLPTEAKSSLRDGRLMCPDEAARCYWNVGFLSKNELKKCRWSNLTFSAELVSKEGILRSFLELLQGDHPAIQTADDKFIRWIQIQNDGNLKSLATAWYITAPKGGMLAVFGELHTSWGFKRGNVMFLMRNTATDRRILGTIVVGSIDGNAWNPL